MATTTDDDAAATFDPLRPGLIRIAYRMLGSVAEAEDIVQDAWLRWHQTDRAAVRDVAAYLARIVARLCLDHLKSARVRRESYIGPWLPEPVIEPVDDERDDLTLTLMMALERLSPLERAALAWTEALTLVSQTHAPDDVYAQLKAQFSEEEQAKLTLAIVTINGWNRFSIGFRAIHPVQRPTASTHVAA